MAGFTRFLAFEITHAIEATLGLDKEVLGRAGQHEMKRKPNLVSV